MSEDTNQKPKHAVRVQVEGLKKSFNDNEVLHGGTGVQGRGGLAGNALHVISVRVGKDAAVNAPDGPQIAPSQMPGSGNGSCAMTGAPARSKAAITATAPLTR